VLLGVRLAALQRVEEVIVGAERPDDRADLLGRLRGGGRGGAGEGRLVALLAVVAMLAGLLVVLLALAAGIRLCWRRRRRGGHLGRLPDRTAQGDPLRRRHGSGFLLGGHQSVAQDADDEEQAAVGEN